MSFVVEHRTPGFTRFAEDVMHAGGDRRVLGTFAVAVLVLALVLRAWRAVLAGVVALEVASHISPALKDVVERPRPSGALALVDLGGYAWPSSHAFRAAALSAGVVVGLHLAAPLERRIVAGVAIAANLLLGVLLVYLGSHWPTDVLAGWVLGTLIGWLVARLILWVWPPGGRAARSARHGSHRSSSDGMSSDAPGVSPSAAASPPDQGGSSPTAAAAAGSSLDVGRRSRRTSGTWGKGRTGAS
jgi:membrane-associated phospholipid phosphatase